MDILPLVLSHTRWQHNNGNKYTVMCLTNINNDNPKYPRTIVYYSDNGKMWSRPFEEWHRLFTLIPIGES